MRKVIFITVLGLLAVSCKNRTTARTLEGIWYETKVDGVAVPEGSQDQFTFGRCNGGANKQCDFTWTDCCGGGSFSNFYTVTDGGETLVLTTSFGLVGTSKNHIIKSITDKELVIEWRGFNGDYVGTYNK